MNNFEKMTAALKKTQDKIFIYGTGNYAKKLYIELKLLGIGIDGFITSDEFYSFDTLNDIPVYAVSNFLDNLSEPCNVVIGFGNCPLELETKLRELIPYIYMADPANIMMTGEWSMTDFYEAHKDKFLEFRNELNDEESKNVFDMFIDQRCNLSYRKPYSNKIEYFDDDIITLEENEVLIDCGAYTGDTVISFVEQLKAKGISGYKKIYAFEADVINISKCTDNLSGVENVKIIPKGVYDKTCVLSFNKSGTDGSSVSEDGSCKIEATSIDEVVNGEKVTFIKMDIEGSELKALHGAEKTIRKHRPKLAVCVYHKSNDLITIPQYIKNLDPTYKLYLRKYVPCGFDLILYAV